MSFIFQFLTMMLTALFVENIIFTRALGTSWLFYLTKNPKEILKYTLLLTGVTTLSGIIGYPLRGLLHSHEMSHVLVPIMFIAITAAVYLAAYFVIIKFFPEKFENPGLNLGTAVFNCAALGTLLVPANIRLDLISTVGYGIGMSLGFGLAAVIVGYGLTRLEYCRVPII